jgi:hypothetical protein
MKRYLANPTGLNYKIRQYPIMTNEKDSTPTIITPKPNPNCYDSDSLEKGYQMGWTKAVKTFKQAKESVRKVIINDFNIQLDLLRDQMYKEHVRKHKIKVAG